MNKIFQLITSIQLGGAEIVAFDLTEHCGKELSGKPEIIVVELYGTLNDYALSKKKELLSKNVRVITLHKGSKKTSLLLAPLSLIRLIKKERPQIIHSHTDLPDFVLAAASRLAYLLRIKMPQVVRTIHNTQLWRTHHRMGKITESAYQDDSVVAVSSNALVAYEKLRKKYSLSVSINRQIIYNGCDIPEKRPHPFPIDKEKINVAYCGRFEDYKGMENLIPTIGEVGRRYPERFAFYIIGDGTYKKQLENLSRKYKNVFLYEPIPNVASLLHAFDYLFMPSHFEGLGLISIESSLSGVPVIASHAPGLDETLPENWPLKFHLDNKEELYDIFERINIRRYNNEVLKKMAFDFVSEKFSQQKMIHSYSTIYKNML